MPRTWGARASCARRPCMECSVRWCVSVALAVGFTLVIAGSARTTFADGADDSCAGVTGAARGLCNAYCKAQDCPDGHNGQSCARLRANWLKQTGAALFPCDAVCCECPGGGDACTTAQQCRLRQCRIIDTCQDGQCPAAVCCQCPAGGCDETTPRHCLSLGCAPAAGATCSSSGVCESPPPSCQCGDPCTDAANNPGTCEPAPDGACQCVATPPPPPVRVRRPV